MPDIPLPVAMPPGEAGDMIYHNGAAWTALKAPAEEKWLRHPGGATAPVWSDLIVPDHRIEDHVNFSFTIYGHVELSRINPEKIIERFPNGAPNVLRAIGIWMIGDYWESLTYVQLINEDTGEVLAQVNAKEYYKKLDIPLPESTWIVFKARTDTESDREVWAALVLAIIT